MAGKRERLEAVFAGEKADRTPILGGWLACPEHVQTLAGATEEQYWEDPRAVSIRAYEALGMDGLIDVFVPRSRGEYRCVDRESFQEEKNRMSLEEAAAAIDAMPSAEESERAFDFDAAYAGFRQSLVEGRAGAGEMLWMPAQWGMGAQCSWYGEFGYENYFLLITMHPDRMRKLMRIGGARGLRSARLLARAVEEGLYPRAVLFGEDICTQRGPMVAPEFLEELFAPELERGLRPLLDVGCKPVWHCDGDCRAILDMLLRCGVQGFQGFQPECGMGIEFITAKRTRDGERLLIFGPIAVTTELPVLSADAIRARVRNAIEVCEGNADLALFTGNTINPDVPLENILAMYEAARE